MNQRVKTLFQVSLALVILTQALVLHWGPEAIFFVTWLLLALTVQHDSRLSAVMGLVFLAICPFLLVAKKGPVAEQAANYAYFFLAIGVLVQLEELVLERFGWLDRKLDFSDQWHLAGHALRQGWYAVIHGFSRQPEQVVLTMSSVRPAALSHGQAWLLRGLAVLVVLPLGFLATIWLSNLKGTNQPAQSKVGYDFIDHLDIAIHPTPPGDGEVLNVQDWTIGQETHRVLYQAPSFAGSSRILYHVNVVQHSKLVFDVAMDPASWNLKGDGVKFSVYLVADGMTHQVFSTYIDPKHNKDDQDWHPNSIDLEKYSGKLVTFIFETNTGPMGDYRYDWAGWGEPRLLQP